MARVLRPGGRLIVVVGANLLPIGPISFVLTLLHALVYGAGAGPVRRSRRLPAPPANQPDERDEHDFTAAGAPIPLELAGLRRSEERVTSRGWEAFVVMGEKVK
jgi:hypothetical protein